MTNALLPYASFRGWSWAANWWNFDNATDETFTQTQINTYNSDLATAQSTGVWNASGTGILDTMANSRLNCPVDAWNTFASTPVIQANPQLVQATGGALPQCGQLSALHLQRRAGIRWAGAVGAVHAALAHHLEYRLP